MGDFLKEVPHAPKNFNGRERKGSPQQLLLSLFGEGNTLFQRYYRELMGPYPLRSTIVGAHSICARHEEKRQSNGRSKPLPYQESNAGI